ncbi:hypothetical protein N0V82_004957 [Gnomoniopsis sp. IMI 355080]|nr:hypothetical protein N0V82_004957 [Gnomoniopsis sp. IMI 355080]
MSVTYQKVWDMSIEDYHVGPDLTADNKSFAGHCTQDSISRVKKARVDPTTTSNDTSRDTRSWATRQLAPSGNQFAGFKTGETTSQLWLTTYPFIAQTDKRLTGETLLFHVHLATEAIEEPTTAGWISLMLPELAAEPPLEITSWKRPVTRLQVAPAPTSGDGVVADDNPQSGFVANEGPILRASVDILYLDKTFWRQYFDRYNRKMDIFIPGVYPLDLAQIQKVAVDIAVLRNRDEFAAVARAIARHLPNITDFSAIVTKTIPRALGGSGEQIAILEEGLPDVFVSFEEKVRLGVHENTNLIPAQGIVSANLSRLNVLAAPTRALQTRYMLLAHFDDAVQSLYGESADIDLPAIDRGQGPVHLGEDAGLKTDSRKANLETPGASAPTGTRSTNITNARAESGTGVENTSATTTRTFKQSPASRLAEIPDHGAPPKRRTVTELAVTRKAQMPWKRAFRSDHPGDYVIIPTSGEGLLCAWRALEASWNAATPRIARATRLPEASLKGLVTVNTLQETLARDRQDPDSNLADFGVVAVRDFTVDHAARIFSQLVKNRTGLAMDLGWIGPLQQSAFGGNKNDLAYVLLEGSSDANQQPAPAVCRLWIWNNNEPRAGHYEGIKDAPAGTIPYF